MPFNAKVEAALAALQQPIAEFRAAVKGALTQAEAFAAEQGSTPDRRATQAALGLGNFGTTRIDAGKFAALFPAAAPADAEAMKALHRAIDILQDVSSRGDAIFSAEVTPGRRLGTTIDDALAAAGAAFGAIVVTELVRGGRYRSAEHDGLLDASTFREWNRAERRFAPPLVVTLDGADLHPGALLDFADGREKLVLVVRGDAPPAPLTRCITPGTLVLQSVSGAGLERIAGFEGPAIAAIMPESSAEFLHDPTVGGNETWQRLSVQSLGTTPKKALGGMSAWQMEQDLKMLADLARTPFAVPGAAGGKGAPAMGATDAVDRIAHWLLESSGLPGKA